MKRSRKNLEKLKNTKFNAYAASRSAPKITRPSETHFERNAIKSKPSVSGGERKREKQTSGPPSPRRCARHAKIRFSTSCTFRLFKVRHFFGI